MSTETSPNPAPKRPNLLDGIIRFCLENKLVVALLVVAVTGWGVLVAPFDWDLGPLPRWPVPTDAIPDIGENQQIIFTEWMGRSPQDVEDQITYPLTVALLGVPGVKTIRSYSYFGFSTIYVIFEEDVEFYWSRTRVLEKLNSLPAGTLPEGVQPALGPDATPLGQIFWYTLEGRDPDGKPVGGWDLHELRTIQDWYVRYYLAAAPGISEVASIGGYVQEYQIDVDPDAMRAYGVSLHQIFQAVRKSNIDVGARSIEINRVEYFIRGLGFIRQLKDIEQTVVAVRDNVPVYIKNVAKVTLGPALRRGALDKAGAEAVGGVVVVRYGYNPLKAIQNIKEVIRRVAPGLPTKAVVDYSQVTREQVEALAKRQGFDAYDPETGQLNHEAWVRYLRSLPREKWPRWITTSQVTIVPFYDRTGLIYETLGTLNTALVEEILVTIIVVILSVMHLRSSMLISALLPLAVLMTFIAMKSFGVDANIVALSGIAIAIGTMVDMGIVLCENMLRHLDEAPPEENRLEVIFRAASEVGSAVLTAVATTVVSFLPVFTMTGPEGKLFKPLAFTKTFALIASVVVALVVLPPAAHVLFATRVPSRRWKAMLYLLLGLGGVVLAWHWGWWGIGLTMLAVAAYHLAEPVLPVRLRGRGPLLANSAAVVIVGIFLTQDWLPLGPERGFTRNFLFVAGLIGGLLAVFQLFQNFLYRPLLAWSLRFKKTFLLVPLATILLGGAVWLGFDTVFGWVPAGLNRLGLPGEKLRGSRPWQAAAAVFPGLGKEFMPPLDEGSFLYMPTTMPHASIAECLDLLKKQDRLIASIPEIDTVVGKLGRVESPLDPAPISMFEITISYKPEYKTDRNGRRINYKYDEAKGEFVRDAEGNLIEDPNGRPFRQWRDHIRTPNDIWAEIQRVARLPSTTAAPKLQPIAARIVMLQSGMRAPLGVKIKGPDLDTIERVGLEIERFLKEVPSVEPSTVVADRVVGKPYVEIEFDREKLARYGLTIRDVQDVVEVAIGGRRITTTVEGRERFPVRVRYMRELRDQIETMKRILIPTPEGAQIPLEQVAYVHYVRGPQVIKSEDTFLTSYVIFDMKPGRAEVDVVEECQRYLQQKIASGELVIPRGVTYSFAGSYENQVRSQRTLSIVLPVALFVIFLILYFQFKSVVTTTIVFSGILVAWAGGFLMVWLYGQEWFLNFDVFGVNMRHLFQVRPINLSVAIWVGFLALFGIASDNGVIISTYLDQRFAARKIDSPEEARQATIEAGMRRVRPSLMTAATTILALLPVLTSTGRGADIMVPMAIPSFGGMVLAMLSLFVVPVLYCWVKEFKLRHGIQDELFREHASGR